MTGMQPHDTPLAVAKESMAMGKESGDRTFKIMAIAMMAVTGLATLFHAVHTLWRDVRDERRNSRENGRSPPPPTLPSHASAASADEPGPQRRWSQDSNLASRALHENQGWTARSQQGREPTSLHDR
jgi:hypothetical protein